MTITGGCLCREIRDESTSDPIVTRICWCRVCQYLGAGGGTVNVCFPTASLTVRGAQVRQHDPAADTETSTAAFYVAAALHPAARGLVALPAEALQRAIAACHRAVAEDGTYAGASADVLPSWDVKTYEHCPNEPSPWAQGAAVRAFAALAQAG